VSEWSWVAGVLEGDGTFPVRKHGRIGVKASMADHDIIEKLATVTGVGHVRPEKRRDGRKSMLIWEVSQWKDAEWVCGAIFNQMSPRRQEQIRMGTQVEARIFETDPVAWAGGYLDAEACFGLGRSSTPRIDIEATDLEPMQRVQGILGGSLTGPHPGRLDHHSPTWSWWILNAPALEAMAVVREWLSFRRTDKVDDILAACAR